MGKENKRQILLPSPIVSYFCFLFIHPLVCQSVMILWLCDLSNRNTGLQTYLECLPILIHVLCLRKDSIPWAWLLGNTGQLPHTYVHVLILSFPLCLPHSPKNDPQNIFNLYSLALDYSHSSQRGSLLQPLLKLRFLRCAFSREHAQTCCG